jgi:hypothetical protein
MKLAIHSSHRPHRHHSCLICTCWDGSPPCICLGLPWGISLAGDMPHTHRRPKGRVGTRPEGRDGMSNRLTLLTLTGYHRLSVHDSPLRTIRVGRHQHSPRRVGTLHRWNQNTLNTHVQSTTQWHQQQQQQFADINALLRQQQEAQAA